MCQLSCVAQLKKPDSVIEHFVQSAAISCALVFCGWLPSQFAEDCYCPCRTLQRAITNPVAAPNNTSEGKCAPLVMREKLMAVATP